MFWGVPWKVPGDTPGWGYANTDPDQAGPFRVILPDPWGRLSNPKIGLFWVFWPLKMTPGGHFWGVTISRLKWQIWQFPHFWRFWWKSPKPPNMAKLPNMTFTTSTVSLVSILTLSNWLIMWKWSFWHDSWNYVKMVILTCHLTEWVTRVTRVTPVYEILTLVYMLFFISIFIEITFFNKVLF